MRQRIITGILFTLGVALFIVPAYWHPLPSLILFSLVALQASREIVQALRIKGLKPNLVVASLGSLLMILTVVGSSQFNERFGRGANIGFTEQLAGGFALMAFVLLATMSFSVIALLIKRGPEALPDAVATAAVMAYVAFPLSCPVLLTQEVKGGWLWLLVGLATPWISDCFAYFTGFLIGRHPIIPAISPKKTLEGCLGGMAGSMLVLPLIFQLFRHTLDIRGNLTPGVIVFAVVSGLVLSIASQFGDWLASGIKRWCGIKDFGKFLPGHGGIMDRFDSAFFTLPMALALAVLFQMIFAQ